jgi:hypothetical protein
MSPRVNAALGRFQSHPDAPLGNCAEAIFTAFEVDTTAYPSDARSLRRLAKGKAPGGVCGAYYAGAHILERTRPDLVDEFEDRFRSHAGCTSCRTIRRGDKADCRGCVHAAAVFLDEALPAE